MLEGFVDASVILRPAVYALVRDGVVVYVGQASRAAIARIEAHRSNWGRKRVPTWMPISLRGVLFDQVFVMPVRVEQLDEVEAAMINLYKPRYNIKLKTPEPVMIAHLFAGVSARQSIHTGASAHSPHVPSPVFERRF